MNGPLYLKLSPFSPSFHLLNLEQLTACRFHALSVTCGTICTTHWGEQMAAVGSRREISDLHLLLCPAPWRAEERPNLGTAVQGHPRQQKDLTQLSHLIDEDIEIQRGRVLFLSCSKSQCVL